MSWMDKFWTAYGVVVNTAIDTTASTLNAMGSIACKIGGVGFAMSYGMDETIKASYYGSANSIGQVNMGIDLVKYKYSINGSIPFQYDTQRDGGASYHIKDYIHPDTVRAASALFTLSGTALRVLSANIKQWQQGREDTRYIKNKYGVQTTGTSIKEYFYVTAGTVCSSLSDSLLSCAATSTLINYSGIIGSNYHFTYPKTSSATVKSSNYQGPVQSSLIPLGLKIEQNITRKLPYIPVDVLIQEKIEANALINATYGGGLSFKSNDNTNLPAAIPASLGIGAYLASTFFARKAARQRDDRMQETHRLAYDMV